MCGFAGIISWTCSHCATPELLGHMIPGVAHRGPDAQQTWINRPMDGSADLPQVGLAHCRLSILDPEPRSDQPFAHPNGCRIVYNGELYNYRELRQQLTAIRPDYVWRTQGDTEVLLQSYVIWGDSCFERFDGMFALAIWDPSANRLLLARDRMGQKPLYWASPDLSDDPSALPGTASAIAFASEPASLKVIPWVQMELSQTSMAHYLSCGYIAAPRTIWRAVRKLPRASILSMTGSGSRLMSIPDMTAKPGTPAAPTTLSQAVDMTRQRVLAAVKKQMVSDVPIGCFLSGGIDSSIIALAMVSAASNARDVHAFSIGFDDPRYDESPYAQRVAAHLGVSHHLLRVTPDAIHDLQGLAKIFGEPFADSSALPTLYLSRFTRQKVKVALSGDGGDELFGGYDRYRAMRVGQTLEHIPRFLRRWIGYGASHLLTSGHPKSIQSKLRRLLTSLSEPSGRRYASYMQLMDAGSMLELLPDAPGMVQEADQWLAGIFEQTRTGHDDVRAAIRTDQRTYLPEDLFTKVDRAAMSIALEVRSPLMDPDVIRLAASLPTRWMMNRRHGKLPFRMAFANDLPPEVWTRSKMGFAVPIGQWFVGPLRSMVHDTLLSNNSFISGILERRGIQKMIGQHERGIDQGSRIFALLMLEWWGQHQRSHRG